MIGTRSHSQEIGHHAMHLQRLGLAGLCLILCPSAENLEKEIGKPAVLTSNEEFGKGLFQSTPTGPKEAQCPGGKQITIFTSLMQKTSFSTKSGTLTEDADEMESDITDEMTRNMRKASAVETDDPQTRRAQKQVVPAMAEEVLKKKEAAADQKPMPPAMPEKVLERTEAVDHYPMSQEMAVRRHEEKKPMRFGDSNLLLIALCVLAASFLLAVVVFGEGSSLPAQQDQPPPPLPTTPTTTTPTKPS